jgi:diguanylate cyclase (GGDEF)-like protein
VGLTPVPTTPAPSNGPLPNPITQLSGKFPSFRSSGSALRHLKHGNSGGTTQRSTVGTADGTAVAVASTTSHRAASATPPAGTTAAAASAASTGGSPTTSHATHKTAKHASSGGSSLPDPLGSTERVVQHFVKVIPTAVWIALGAAFGLALAFAAIALRAGRRATRREREFKAISAAAATDALTGILNRRGFMDAAERELARASRYDRPFVLAYVDVRGLKAVNDTEGHLVGDELIKTVAGLMKESARADDVVGRIGGDEFALLLDEQTADGAQPVLRRIRSRVEEARAAMETREPWELTIGIAAFPDDGTTLEELLGTADRRLYEQRGIALR